MAFLRKEHAMFKKLMIQLALVIGLSLTIPMTACTYTIEADPINFTYFPGSATNELIVLHESGNERNLGPHSLDNEVAYMKRNWSNAYVSYFVGSGGRVKQLAPAGQIQYGAGSLANQKAYAQIELARTNNATTFKKDYAAYVNLARDLAQNIGADFSLDDGTGYGIVTHDWITKNWWGDHTDPYGYLARWGISKAQLAQDLQTGVSETGETVIIQPGKPNAPKYQVGQAIRFTSIYPTPDALINEHLSAEALWTQVGTITAKLPDRQNLYRIENSGHLLGYVNDGDIAELWRPQTKKSFLIGVDEGIVLRAGQPSLSAPIYGIWPKNTRFYYDAFYIADGYVFIGGTDTSGARIYLPIGPNDGNAQNTWGSFTS
ncbi:SH3 domain-containing protein [Enterococcus faecalis]|uniref:SH3 domain-containing protein n=1 Tax=Enterococcus faecalis TaxID=1351 RepID=UPI003DA15F86